MARQEFSIYVGDAAGTEQYPARFAQDSQEHHNKAVQQACAEKALMKIKRQSL